MRTHIHIYILLEIISALFLPTTRLHSPQLGEPLTAFEIREMIERADVDGDNKVSFKEFYNIMTSKQFE